MTPERLQQRRLSLWRQDGKRNVPNAVDAVEFIEQMGLCPLYRASPEFPDLLHAHTSNPETKAEASWDSVSGDIYTWRWKIGKEESAFYASVVAKKPTWVAWTLLPFCLAALMERRTHDELFDAGLISSDAYRIAVALEESGGVLSTKELRKRAGFPIGKDSRKVYLHAVEELEALLLLAKKMSQVEGDDEMSHALISSHYLAQTVEALAMSQVDGLTKLVDTYVSGSGYISPTPFARALRVAKPVVLDCILRLELESIECDGRTIYFRTEPGSL